VTDSHTDYKLARLELTLDAARLPDLVRRAARAAFPDYRGRKFAFRRAESVLVSAQDLAWSGGTRSRFVRVALPSMRTAFVHAAGSVAVGADEAVVEHARFQGEDFGLTFYAPDPAALGIAEPLADRAALTMAGGDCEIVLAYTAELRPGFRQYRAGEDTGITNDRWQAAVAECVRYGWLRANGAITPAGRNALTRRSSEIAWDLRHRRQGC
jgi:hypothetical protein